MKKIIAIVDRARASRAMLLCALLCLLPMAAGAQSGAPATPRFLDNGDGTVSDRLTGLMWEKAPSSERVSATESESYVKKLALAGHADWRLPSRVELASLVQGEQADHASWLNSQGFRNVQHSEYWSSTLFEWMGYSTPDRLYAWVVDLSSGDLRTELYWDHFTCAWAVRGEPGEGE